MRVSQGSSDKANSFTVAAGTPKLIDMSPYPTPCTCTAVPGGGGSLLVEHSTTPGAAANPGSATWTSWPNSTVSSTTEDILTAPVTALRITATTAAGVFEITA